MKFLILLLLSLLAPTRAFYELAYLLAIAMDGGEVHPSCRFENETDTLHEFADEILEFIFLGSSEKVEYFYLGNETIDDRRNLGKNVCAAPPFCRLPEWEQYCILLGCPKKKKRRELFFDFDEPDEYETLEAAMEDAIVVPLSSYEPFNDDCDPEELSLLIFVQPSEVEGGDESLLRPPPEDFEESHEDWTRNWEAWQEANGEAEESGDADFEDGGWGFAHDNIWDWDSEDFDWKFDWDSGDYDWDWNFDWEGDSAQGRGNQRDSSHGSGGGHGQGNGRGNGQGNGRGNGQGNGRGNSQGHGNDRGNSRGYNGWWRRGR